MGAVKPLSLASGVGNRQPITGQSLVLSECLHDRFLRTGGMPIVNALHVLNHCIADFGVLVAT